MRARAAAAGAALAVLALLTGCAGSTAPAGTEPSGRLTVLAAASLTDAFEEFAAMFESEHPRVEVVLTFGGSTALAEQVLAGAPADVFASADETTMARLTDAEVVVTPVVVATNRLDLVVPAGNPGGVTGLADLADPRLTVALCDPSVPCGAASERVLARAGVTASVDTLEPDVRAVLTKVVLGEVDAALVYRTDARAAGEAVETFAVPAADEVVSRYPVAVLDGAANASAARAFVDLLLSDRARKVFDDVGFGQP